MSPARSAAPLIEDVAAEPLRSNLPVDIAIGSFPASLRDGAYVVKGEADHYFVKITSPGQVLIEDHFGGETHRIAAAAKEAWLVLEQREAELCRDGKFDQSPGAKLHTTHAAICVETARFHGDIR